MRLKKNLHLVLAYVILPRAYSALTLGHGYVENTNEVVGKVSMKLNGIASQTAAYISVLDSSGTSMLSVSAAGALVAVTAQATTITGTTVTGTTITDGTTTSTGGVITGVVDLTVNAVKVGSTGAVLTSDRRLKENIRNISEPLVLLNLLRGVRFAWRAEAPGATQRATPNDVGFIAQEIEDVLPELVVSGHSGFKSVAYNGVIPVLVEGIKAQQAQIEQLTSANDGLNLRIEALEAALGKLLASDPPAAF